MRAFSVYCPTENICREVLKHLDTIDGLRWMEGQKPSGWIPDVFPKFLKIDSDNRMCCGLYFDKYSDIEVGINEVLMYE